MIPKEAQEEFKLIEKITVTQKIRNGKLIESPEGSIDTSKVKEFIRLLKEEMCRCKTMVGEGKKCYACRNIDKLSGFSEDLILARENE